MYSKAEPGGSSIVAGSDNKSVATSVEPTITFSEK